MSPLPIIPIAAALAREFLPGLVGKITNSKKGEKLAEAVVATAMEVTGTGTGNAALAALKSDPQKVIEFQARVFQHHEVILQIEAADRKDARGRDVAMRSLSQWGNWRGDVLAFAALALLWRIVEALINNEFPSDGVNRDMLVMLIPAVILIVKDVFQFEFGSSRGSKSKDAALFERAD